MTPTPFYCLHCNKHVTEADIKLGWFFIRNGFKFCSATCHALYLIDIMPEK